MSFTSFAFAIFALVVLAVYWRLRGVPAKRALVIASYAFYAMWDWRFTGLLLLTTVADFTLGGLIASAPSERRRNVFLGVSLAVNLGVLAAFKYLDFFFSSILALTTALGFHVSAPALRIALPVGISFYTFRSLSYTIDIRLGRLRPTTSMLDYALFVSFFPLLGAGPIVRARRFLPQLNPLPAFSWADVEAGLSRFLLGFCKKAFIADTLGLLVVDPVFAHPSSYGPTSLLLALVAYAIQIYADFSGYSSMAIGISRIFGFRIDENFAFPYRATNIADFWRRWHISLTSWLRDYIWWPMAHDVPFTAAARRTAAVLLVFLASGLWHGAGWTFIAWGFLHGCYVAIHQQWQLMRARVGAGAWGARLGWIGPAVAFATTQAAVLVAWLVFRSPDFPAAGQFLAGMVGAGGGAALNITPVVWVALGGFVIDHWAMVVIRRWPTLSAGAIRGLGYATLLVFLWHAVPDRASQFIYFRF